MISSVNDILTIVKSKELTPQQKLIALGNTSERIFSPVDLLGYTEEELSFLENQMVCDLNEKDRFEKLKKNQSDIQV